MADDKTSRSAVAGSFKCGYCPRKYTKKEHLQRHERAHSGSKPFKCVICGRSFSRGDVLKRHVRGHGAAASTTEQTLELSDFPEHRGSSPWVQNQETPMAAGAAGAVTARSVGGSVDMLEELSPHDASHIPWPASTAAATIPNAPQEASSLLWPDSEYFYQSLTSLDGMALNPSMPAAWQMASFSQEASNNARTRSSGDRPRYDEFTSAEDGRRAVQTANVLVTETLFSVTSPDELSDLTPRFLDSSLHLFFTKFIPIFPVIHRPTFIYRECSALLLLNAIALGSLFLGSEDAVTKGEALWRLAYTAIATSWPTMVSQRREYDQCNGVELVLTALLSQIYAALSRNRTLRMTSQTFYGLSMHWAQYCGMYDICEAERPNLPLESHPVEAKLHAWKRWAARETQLRMLLGLCVIDGVVSQFSGNLVNTWQATKSLPLSSDNDSFNAESPDAWISHMNAFGRAGKKMGRFCDLYHSLLSSKSASSELEKHDLGLFDLKSLLEIVGSVVKESQRTDPTPVESGSKLKMVQALSYIRQHIVQSRMLTATDRAVGLIRWHAVCLDMLASVARGARRMCQQYNITQHILGGEKRQESRIDPLGWIQGVPARKCLLHASEIHSIASELPLGAAHDVYLPGALFAAATTYSSFALGGISKIHIPNAVDWNTVLFWGLDEMIPAPLEMAPSEAVRDTTGFLSDNRGDLHTVGLIARNLSYDLSSLRLLLRGLSLQWGVAQEMEKVVEAWTARCA